VAVGIDPCAPVVLLRSPLFQYFPAYPTAAVNHFNELWTKTDSMAEFIEDLQDAVDYTKSNIGYESNWLAIYEYALPQEDEELKTIELARVEEVLREEIKTKMSR
jgi:hypothetical protein